MPDRAVVALDIGILLGLAGLDIGQGYAPLFCPIDQRPADIVRTIVDPNGQGLTSPLNDPIKSADNTLGRQRKVHLNPQPLTIIVVQHIEQTEYRAAWSVRPTGPFSRQYSADGDGCRR